MKKVILFFNFVLFLSTCFAQTVPSAESILSTAYKKAAMENKNVFIIFHASWCGWCKKLDASMNDSTIKKYFDDNFITIHLTVQETAANKKLENSGADTLLAKYKGERAGLPFFLILDNKSNLIDDSFLNNENTGCPANEKEVDYFIKILRKSTKIDEKGLYLIKKRFRKNEAH